ncbi:MAG: hypothetical protein DHS20C14_22020 [Phycisphaeraceae bacterium]|nr:MAG: hypothetical protein DHS20C14_22020 [Phycisphaeraceae bacterium]
MRDSNGPFRVVFTRAGGQAGRAVRFAQEQPSWLTKAVLFAVVFAVGVVALFVLVPLLILALAAFVVLALVGWVRSLFVGAHKPNGPLDGRRNVRVIRPGGSRPSVDSRG